MYKSWLKLVMTHGVVEAIGGTDEVAVAVAHVAVGVAVAARARPVPAQAPVEEVAAVAHLAGVARVACEIDSKG